jgi:mono/diheme cytochrome c family protein
MARNPLRRRAGRGLALVGALMLASCNWYYDTLPSPDDLMKLVPWFDHMITSPAVAPYSRLDVPRRTVPGTVPVTGGEADWSQGDPSKLIWAFDTLVANALPNPLGPDELLARGDTVYRVFCALCHGDAGEGNGVVGRRLAAPSLLTDKARAFSDGYLYGIVRYGRGVMPWYGDKIYEPRDRWAVVNYVRSLQAAADAGAAR